MATDLLVISIRRRLDKGETIKGNEIRMLLAMIEALKKRIADLEQLPLIVVSETAEEGAQS